MFSYIINIFIGLFVIYIGIKKKDTPIFFFHIILLHGIFTSIKYSYLLGKYVRKYY